MIDWLTFLSSNRIDSMSTGPSTAKGNIYVSCPWCGTSDQGKHLGISTHSPWRGYGCWRQASHRGKSASKLVAALLGIGQSQAQRLIGEGAHLALEDDAMLFSRVKGILEGEPQAERVDTPLEFPKEIKRLDPKAQGASKLFVEYLVRERSWERGQIGGLCVPFLLRYALAGPFTYRLIFPVYTHDGLTTWTGRSIVEGQELRYMSLSPDPEKSQVRGLPSAKAPISDCLFNELSLINSVGRLLIVCEGPIDAMRVDYAATEAVRGVRATCLFGKRVSDAQVDKLMFLTEQYDRVILLLDNDADMDLLYSSSRLEPFGIATARIPSTWKDDPGATPLVDLTSFIKKELRREIH